MPVATRTDWPLDALDRRAFLRCVAGIAVASTAGGCRLTASGARGDLATGLARLERTGRLGVAVLDTATGQVRGHRLDERFAMCSTFKLPLAAMVLARAACGGRPLDARLRVSATDLLKHAPFARAAVDAAASRGETFAESTLAELAEAAQTTSDNTAANLLLRDLGGPTAFTSNCIAHGDTVTRLDRYEPEMNDVRGDDVRDTTTPRAMARLMAGLLTEGLPVPARQQLRQWMHATATGAARVRAGLPPEWFAGDKTGTGGGDGVTVKCNDVVWIEPPGRVPLVVAAYYDTGRAGEWPSEEDEAVLADVGRLVARCG